MVTQELGMAGGGNCQASGGGDVARGKEVSGGNGRSLCFLNITLFLSFYVVAQCGVSTRV